MFALSTFINGGIGGTNLPIGFEAEIFLDIRILLSYKADQLFPKFVSSSARPGRRRLSFGSFAAIKRSNVMLHSRMFYNTRSRYIPSYVLPPDHQTINNASFDPRGQAKGI